MERTRNCPSGGRGGIRTHGTLAGTPVFKTGALNHSATLPEQEAQSLSVGPARTQCEHGPMCTRSRHFRRSSTRRAARPGVGITAAVRVETTIESSVSLIESFLCCCPTPGEVKSRGSRCTLYRALHTRRGNHGWRHRLQCVSRRFAGRRPFWSGWHRPGSVAAIGADVCLAESKSQQARAQEHETGRGQSEKSVGDYVVVAHETPTTQMLVGIY